MAVTSAIFIIANVSLNFKFNLRKEAEITSRGHYQEKNTAVAMGGARRRRVAERSGAMEAGAGTPDVATHGNQFCVSLPDKSVWKSAVSRNRKLNSLRSFRSNADFQPSLSSAAHKIDFQSFCHSKNKKNGLPLRFLITCHHISRKLISVIATATCCRTAQGNIRN